MVPRIFSIETVLGCNLRCPECAIGGGKVSRKRGCLDFDSFKVIADKIRPFADYVYLHLWGEPFLNKDIFRIIHYASEFARTHISTNAQMVTQEMAEELIRSGVSDLLLSIDGLSQEVYEKYRRYGSVSKALQVLEWLQEYNLKYYGITAFTQKSRRLLRRFFPSLRQRGVNISPQFIVFKHNQHEMRSFGKYCRRLGLKPAFKAPYFLDGVQLVHGDDPKYHRSRFRDLASVSEAMTTCSSPRDGFTILLDGSVVGCCYDYNGTYVFGNIFKQEVLEIWNSPGYREFRHSILTGSPPELCLKDCLLYILEPREPNQNMIDGTKAAPLDK